MITDISGRVINPQQSASAAKLVVSIIIFHGFDLNIIPFSAAVAKESDHIISIKRIELGIFPHITKRYIVKTEVIILIAD